jgi:hypothetical protein
MNPEKAEGLSPELRAALAPLLAAMASVSEHIAEYNEGIEKLAQENYPQVALLKQVKGVGTVRSRLRSAALGPDLDHCKRAVLNSLGSPASRRVYEYAIDQFIAWYCSEPRLAFNRIVVVRYGMHLESRGLAANTINQQLAAVRRLAHEAADAGCSVLNWLPGLAEWEESSSSDSAPATG